jgi:Holliday junction resolvase
MTINSRQKGARGEREFAENLRALGFDARRGQQFSGSPDSPDVVTNIPGVHFEVKRVERGSLYAWLAQAQKDAGAGQIPVVAHRRNNGGWIAILPMGHLLELLRGRSADLRQLPEDDATGPPERADSCPAELVAAVRRRRARRGL